MSFNRFLIVTGLLFSMSSHASRVLVADSGTDIGHEALKSKIWINQAEVMGEIDKDDDGNGLLNDYHGFNFLEMNNQLIDKDALDSLDEDMKTFYKLEYYLTMLDAGYNFITPDLIEWYQNNRSNEKLFDRVGAFGGYAHGTHVAGIVAKGNPLADIATAKVVPSDTSALKTALRNSVGFMPGLRSAEGKKLNLEEYTAFLEALNGMVPMMTDGVVKSAIYAGKIGARTINASFGIGLQMLYQRMSIILMDYNLVQEDILSLSVDIMQQMLSYGKAALEQSCKDALLVVASGNDGVDNDIFLDFPSAINSEQVISVAASLEVVGLASFSNYGIESVDVAAPGVGIYSSAPGEDNYVYMNGTSQAAPFVTRVASKIVDANPELTPGQVRTILMATVDKKEFLKDKVKSGGIVNEERALKAARLTNYMSFEDAISSELLDVIEDVPSRLVKPNSTINVEIPAGMRAIKVQKRPSLI